MKTSLMPDVTVSVVICTYNGEKFLKEQINSILNQTYPVDEIIIQDDGSTDRTVEIADAYCRQDKRVKLYVNPVPLGFNHNFSSAFSKARGSYIASCDQDDVWRPDKIEVLMKHMGNNQLVFHNSCLFTTDINRISGMKNAGNVLYNALYLLLKPYVPGHECFFSRQILPTFMQAVGCEQRISYDSLLMLAAKACGDVSFVNEGLVYWRRHPQATSYHTSGRYDMLSGWISAFAALSDREKRNVTKRYFRAIASFDFHDRDAERTVRFMGAGNLSGILKTCWLCYRNRKRLYPYNNAFQSRVKSFFTPLYFIRDCSKFVIH